MQTEDHRVTLYTCIKLQRCKLLFQLTFSYFTTDLEISTRLWKLYKTPSMFLTIIVEYYKLSFTVENHYHENEKPFKTQPLSCWVFHWAEFHEENKASVVNKVNRFAPICWFQNNVWVKVCQVKSFHAE